MEEKRTQQRGFRLVLAAGFRVTFRLEMVVKFQSEEWKDRTSESLRRLLILRHLSFSLLPSYYVKSGSEGEIDQRMGAISLSPNDAAPLNSALRFLEA